MIYRICMPSCYRLLCQHLLCKEWGEAMPLPHHYLWVEWGCHQCLLLVCLQWMGATDSLASLIFCFQGDYLRVKEFDVVAPSISLLVCYYFPMIAVFFNESFPSHVFCLFFLFGLFDHSCESQDGQMIMLVSFRGIGLVAAV